ncbi:MAG: CcoQ/FixQ family Cbb3-type cytochrome c oxidase assembly chaperone [Acidobacteria bacterium]|nr:CcoQ/FixQ family Cbb3-type cytochrome c oxidase assembly chaperone [Acidobacteriota bacterium]MCB9397466.1 CcoQ/FixQ family Cbb3-type cytochrome c oxidase assembly chaperone [Acidobacteriota bacterium]
MLKTLISQGNYAIWAEASMVIFLIVFLATVVWAFRKRSATHYSYMAHMALENETQEEKEGHHV